MDITSRLNYVGTEGKYLCNPNTHAVHSKVALKNLVARSKSYISLYTLLTIIPCYSGQVYTPKAFDATLIKLRPRRLQRNLHYCPSHTRA